MASILASGIVKALFGGSALALGTAGIFSGFMFDSPEKENIKTEIRKVVQDHKEEVSNDMVSTEKSKAQLKEEKNLQPAQEPAVTPIVAKAPEIKKECRLHKLRSSASGIFEKISKDQIEVEIREAKRGDYKQIEQACGKEVDKDIFISNKNGSGWKYYESDQKDRDLESKFKKYLAQSKNTRV
ncbi:hypothetical protein MHF_0682 [Mycoplasma haemofelis Ohio2]|uniref:Uncharacterized protein n=1 Tax=Mycoplasma haemofelis (strain Ohio2) TaxID=859194 RepID=F6FIA4_MYCHI|nr:hypothetical protein MHF_0682 [Mycoplasma haemofelis Ohio2]